MGPFFYMNLEEHLNNNLLPELINKKFAIAVSGGCDSMALTFLIKKYFPKLEFTALIVDHKFRPESTKEAKWVKNYLEKNNINSTILSLPTTDHRPLTTKHTEESLRNLRYSLITEYCKKNKIKTVLTAHHLDDNIETFLMRLERGSGIDGLSSIPERTEMNGVTFIRPLLSFTKDELKNFLIDNKIKWVEDPSNESDKFTRNKLRKALLNISDYDLLRKRLSGVLENITRASDYLKSQENKEFQNICKLSEYGFIEMNRQDFLELHEEISFRILKDIILKFSTKDIRFENIKNIYNNIISKQDFDITYNNAEILAEKGVIYFFPELSKITSYKPLGEKGLSDLRKEKKKLPKIHYKILRTIPTDYFDK